MEGFQLTRRASRIGFDWDSAEGVLEKYLKRRRSYGTRSPTERRSESKKEAGDLLFAAVNVARFLHVDPEIALKKANAKFAARFREMERLARENGKELADVPRAEMEALWERAKGLETAAAGVAR